MQTKLINNKHGTEQKCLVCLAEFDKPVQRHLDKCKFTLTFFPSSSILYSVIVFRFPLMVSLEGGNVPVKYTH